MLVCAALLVTGMAGPSVGQGGGAPQINLAWSSAAADPGQPLTLSGAISGSQPGDSFQLAIYRMADGATWDGTGFTAAYSRVGVQPTGSSWSYQLTPQDSSKYTAAAFVMDASGNQVASSAWKSSLVSLQPDTATNADYQAALGLSGTAVDQDGTVEGVQLAIYRNGKTWNGSAFTSTYSRVAASPTQGAPGQTVTWAYKFDPWIASEVVVGAFAVDDVGRVDPVTTWQRVQVSAIAGVVDRAQVGPESGVQVDLFTSNGDGDRLLFVKSAVTADDGFYAFGVESGCWVVTFIAPAGDAFTDNDSQWLNRHVCVDAESDGTADATLLRSGEAMPAESLPGWQLIFTDDFPTDVEVGRFPEDVADKWSAYPNTWPDTARKNYLEGNHHGDCIEPGGMYDPGNVVSIEDGAMKKKLHTRASDGSAVTAAVVPRIIPGGTYDPLVGAHGQFDGQTYGRYAVRFKADTDLEGYKAAWLLWPDEPETWPQNGELDFPEGDFDNEIEGYVHWQGGQSSDDQWGAASGTSFAAWHTAVIEWEPDRVAYYLDGQLIGEKWVSGASVGDNSEWTLQTDKIPATSMHWVLQTETSLTDCNIPAPDTEGYVYIDWVAAWSLDAE